jgi:hypothetical protein
VPPRHHRWVDGAGGDRDELEPKRARRSSAEVARIKCAAQLEDDPRQRRFNLLKLQSQAASREQEQYPLVRRSRNGDASAFGNRQLEGLKFGCEHRRKNQGALTAHLRVCTAASGYRHAGALTCLQCAEPGAQHL